jgi:hypothetical protein
MAKKAKATQPKPVVEKKPRSPRTKQILYVVGAQPVGVFLRADLANQVAAEGDLTVYPVTITTGAELRAQKRAAALAKLSPEEAELITGKKRKKVSSEIPVHNHALSITDNAFLTFEGEPGVYFGDATEGAV